MWILLGVITIIATLMNLLMYLLKKDYKLWMAVAISFTALTLCTMIRMLTKWVVSEDWTALLDVAPLLEKSLWTLTILSILLNIMPLLLDYKRT